MAALSEFSTGTAQLELAKKTKKKQPCAPLNQAILLLIAINPIFFSQIKRRRFFFSLHHLSFSLKLNDQHKFILSSDNIVAIKRNIFTIDEAIWRAIRTL